MIIKPAVMINRPQENVVVEYLLFALCIVVYAGTLFFPLMDKDAAHHANIAMHMYRTGDFSSLVDRGWDYLDKPHLLFWVSAGSFEIFGVNSFAHRFPAMLFALLSVYSTYKLTRHLSNQATARIAAIILGTAQAFVLSVTDARMETPLTAFVIFGIWHLIAYFDNKKFLQLLLGSLGVAAAFATKGWLGPIVILVTCFFYLLLNKKWNVLADWRTWMFVPLFFLFVSPVLYSYYLQYDLHPEKVIRGRDHNSGVKFILWGQLFERYKGFDEGGRYSSPFFLYHTFLWAFFPWCIAACVAIFHYLKKGFYLRQWKDPFVFIVISFCFVLVTISFSKFKMPHYIIMLLPMAAIGSAGFIKELSSRPKTTSFFYWLHFSFAIIALLAASLLNFYFFKPLNVTVVIGGLLLVALLVWVLRKKDLSKQVKLVYVAALASIIFNFFMNYNFFPQLLKYQGGNEMAHQMRVNNINIPNEKISLLEIHAHSFEYYRNYNYPIVPYDSLETRFDRLKDHYFLINKGMERDLTGKGFRVEPAVSQVDYNVATVKIKFLREATRYKTLDTLMLARLYR